MKFSIVVLIAIFAIGQAKPTNSSELTFHVNATYCSNFIEDLAETNFWKDINVVKTPNNTAQLTVIKNLLEQQCNGVVKETKGQSADQLRFLGYVYEGLFDKFHEINTNHCNNALESLKKVNSDFKKLVNILENSISHAQFKALNDEFKQKCNEFLEVKKLYSSDALRYVKFFYKYLFEDFNKISKKANN